MDQLRDAMESITLQQILRAALKRFKAASYFSIYQHAGGNVHRCTPPPKLAPSLIHLHRASVKRSGSGLDDLKKE